MNSKKQDKKYQIETDNKNCYKVYCKYCGHSQQIPAFLDEKICSWCRKKIKNTSNAHFNYKLRNAMKEINENEQRRNNKTNRNN